MKKFVTLTLIAVMLFGPSIVNAAVDHAIVEAPYISGSNAISNVSYRDGNTEVLNTSVPFSLNGVNSTASYLSSMMAAVIAEGTNNGYTLTNGVVGPSTWNAAEIQAIASSTATALGPQALSFGSTSRSLNSNYTISTTRATDVVYSISATWSLNALLSGSGAAFLEYSVNGGSSWNTVSQVSKSLALLTFAGADEMNLSGKVPANALVRIRTTSSNMTIAFVRSQEVLLASN